MMRTDTNAKKLSHQEAEVTQDLSLIKCIITVEAGSGNVSIHEQIQKS